MKNMPNYLVEGDDVEIDGELYKDFLKSLVHVFRNIMDHGIETDEERLESGKNGKRTCGMPHLQAGRRALFYLHIRRRAGFDLQKIKNKAIENLLFTADEISEMIKAKYATLFSQTVFPPRIAPTCSPAGEWECRRSGKRARTLAARWR
jgi:two-component system chemotaxis sensor kinase CheA